MMKILKLAALSASLVGVSVASAAAISFSDTYTPSPAKPLITFNTPFNFVFDITPTGFNNGFVPTVDNFTSATLTINVIDNINQGNETFTFTIGQTGALQTLSGSNINNGNGGATIPITLVAALPDLNADGKLNVALSASEGDYNFVNATLAGTFDKGTVVAAAVPEPTSIALLGLGLLGFAASRRKSAK